jgi:predicted metal-binding protein
MADIANGLERLIRVAVEAGATCAKPLKVEDVVLDPRTLLKCIAPLCPHYGHNKMCPPAVIKPDEFQRMLNQYNCAIFIQKEISIDGSTAETFVQKETSSKGDAIHIGKRAAQLHQEPSLQKIRRESSLALYKIIEEVERAALQDGYPFLAGLGYGPCRVCTTCDLSMPCPQPLQARPSMEAVGINVLETARRAGCPVELKHECAGTYTVNGLILVD